MTVRSILIFSVPPTQVQDLVNLITEGRAIVGRLGANNVRAWRLTAAGENAGRITVQSEFDNFAAYGAFADKLATDTDYQALVAKVSGVATLEAAMLADEIPL